MSADFLVRLFDRVDLIKPVSNVRPSVHPSVHEKFIIFNEIWHMWVEVVADARRYAVWLHPRSTSWSRALQSCKSGHFQKLSPPPFTMEAGNWPRIPKLRHEIWIRLGRIFNIWLSFCVTWLETSVAKSRPSVPYGANLVYSYLVASLVDVVRILQQQWRGFCVVLLGSDVERRKMDLSTGVVFQQQCDDLVVTLLERHGQRREPVLFPTRSRYQSPILN